MAKTSPTKRTLDWCRKRGYEAGVVEKWNPFARRSFDLFGFIDIVALDRGAGAVGIQTTSAAHAAERIKKILAEPRAYRWLENRNRIWVHGWKKSKGIWVTNVWHILIGSYGSMIIHKEGS